MRRRIAPIIPALIWLLFYAFAFCFVFFFQRDILAYEQFILSDGLTHYNNWVGAILIIVVMNILSWLTSLSLKNYYFLPAVYHIPSALFLAVVTDINIISNSQSALYGNSWIWALGIIALLYISDKIIDRVTVRTNERTLLFAENLVVLIITMSLVALLSNTSEFDHETLHTLRRLNFIIS